MKYFSPFNFLPYNESSPDETTLLQTRKKLLSEFGLQGDPATINIEGVEIGRNELLLLLDQLAAPTVYDYHRAIYEDKDLLLFLEKQEFPEDEEFADNPLYLDPGFIAFVSPFYSESCQSILTDAFNRRDAYTVETIDWLQKLCTPADEDACYGPLHTQIEQLITAIEAETCMPVYNEKNVTALTAPDMIAFMAELPAKARENQERFFSALLGLCNVLFNNHGQYYKAYDILNYIEKSYVNQEIADRALDYLNQVKASIAKNRGFGPAPQEYKPGTERRREWTRTRSIVVITLIACSLAVRLILYLVTDPNEKSTRSDFYSGVIRESNRKKQAMNARTLAAILHQYYLNRWRARPGAPEGTALSSGDFVYLELDDQNSDALLQAQYRKNSDPQIYLVNQTGEDLALMLECYEPKLSMTRFLRSGDSCITKHLSCVNGTYIYVSAGTRWNRDRSVVSTSDRVLIGAFDRPDLNNMDLLLEPIEIRTKASDAKGKKYCRIKLMRNKQGKIHAGMILF